MKKEYILVLATMAVTAMASATERPIAKCLKIGAHVQSGIRPTEDLTGATADSLIVFAGGEYDGEMMTNGYAYQKQVFERTDFLYVVNNYEMVFGEWKPTTRIETEFINEHNKVTTHYFNNGGGDLVPYYREDVVEDEGVYAYETATYNGEYWERYERYDMIELKEYLYTEDYSVWYPDGNYSHISSTIFFDEQGQVERQEYSVEDTDHPELTRIRTLYGSYNEDGTIHTLQDDWDKFVTVLNPENEKEHVYLYERHDVADPFEFVAEGIETEYSTIEKYYEEDKLSYQTEQTYLSNPDYMGLIYQTTEVSYDTETGEVEFGDRKQYYYPQPDNMELMEKVVTYDWLTEDNEIGKTWAWDYTHDYKYVDGFLYQVQLHGPFIIGYENTDYVYGYTQYYYDELSTGISTVRNDMSEVKQNFDLMGRCITDKVRGLSISNGKVVLNR